ncbi:helix-turn-helix transcriptional regulator [Actinophytocola algeriensis]|uniref:DNA-binding CsgD family transcriptional regulator n=1 Tax=Actinophytocola algeriensis TaxID=1768010 RepID=A0A7W7QFN4_9PSEU|nr:helix-turn-helix transcriptional regulator [Actinophytocola algeriensis]MBB4912800.1 DNA-binding CsgD family transcriptional regulator [Actinophytocola algeriensis]MBE1473532.1 DNA-binding CsgD family transcriptional regulator [Actinophytocola algeriensis]
MDEAGLLRVGLRSSQAIVNGEPFAADLADGLRRVVGADCVCIDVCHDWKVQRPSITLAGEPGTLTVGEVDRWISLYPDDPYVVNLLATGDPRPYRTSDYMTLTRFQDTPIYREVFSRLEMRHLVVMTPSFTEQDLVMIGMTRRLYDFSDRETSAFHPLRDMIAVALEYRSKVKAIIASINVDDLTPPPRHLTLTERENQVLALIATGLTNDQTARKLGISPRTVRKHLEGVFTKANVPSRAAAVAWWLRQLGR